MHTGQVVTPSWLHETAERKSRIHPKPMTQQGGANAKVRACLDISMVHARKELPGHQFALTIGKRNRIKQFLSLHLAVDKFVADGTRPLPLFRRRGSRTTFTRPSREGIGSFNSFFCLSFNGESSGCFSLCHRYFSGY